MSGVKKGGVNDRERLGETCSNLTLYTPVVSLTADNYKSPFGDSSGNLSHGNSPVSRQEASIHQTEQPCTSHQAC